MDIESRSKIALLGGNVDWRTTPIKKWPVDGLVREAARILNPTTPEWFRRDAPGQNHLAAVNELLEGCGLGRLRSRDDSFEEQRESKVRQNESGERGGVMASEIAQHQRDKEKNMGRDELEPEEGESISAWLARLAIHVDPTDPFFMALRSHAERFRGDARKTLDAKVLQGFLDKFRKRGK